MISWRFPLVALVASATLAGCGGAARIAPPLAPAGPQTAAPASGPLGRTPETAGATGRKPENGPGWLSEYALKGAVLFAANTTNATVTIYNATAKNAVPVGLISQGIFNPFGLAVDGAGDLYVANRYGPGGSQSNGNVNVYPPGHRTPAKTYTAGLSSPVGVAVGNDGTVYVANQYGPGGCCNPGNVAVFPPGSTTPSITLFDQNFQTVNAVAVDANGNLYVTYVANGCCPQPTYVDEFLAGSQIPINLGMTSVANGGYFGGIDLDNVGNLVLTDTQQIEVYPPQATSPSRTFGLRGYPIALAFNKSGNLLYVLNNNAQEVEVYSYPAARLVNIFSNGMKGPEAVALRPRHPLAVRSPQPPPPTPTPTPSPSPTPVPTPPAGTVYVGILNQSPNSVTLFDAQSFAQTGQITQGIAAPRGLAFDSAGNLYVSSNTGSGVVNVYSPGQTTPSTTYAQGLGPIPWGVAVANDGTLFVVNDYEPTNVVVYPPGSTTPSATLTDPNFASPYAVAVDSSGNAYVTFGSNSGAQQIDEFFAGSTTPVTLGMSLAGQPLGITVDASGDLVVAEQSDIAVFPPGATSPSQVIGSGQFAEVSGIALDATQSFLYAGDLPNGRVLVFTYPAGSLISTFSVGSNVYPFSLVLSPTPSLGPPWSGMRWHKMHKGAQRAGPRRAPQSPHVR
jgi:hypothetical protein